jgi:nicotinamidase-related amidase
MRVLKDNALLTVVDVQEKLFPHIAENEILEKKILTLIEGIKILDVPIFVTEQYVKGLGSTINSVSDSIEGISRIEKMSFSCCGEPSFDINLKNSGKDQIILCGIETHVCVLQTALDLVEEGFEPILVTDAVSSRNLNDKYFAIERMKQEGVKMATVESILFEIARISGTANFKAISKLVR